MSNSGKAGNQIQQARRVSAAPRQTSSRRSESKPAAMSERLSARMERAGAGNDAGGGAGVGAAQVGADERCTPGTIEGESSDEQLEERRPAVAGPDAVLEPAGLLRHGTRRGERVPQGVQLG